MKKIIIILLFILICTLFLTPAQAQTDITISDNPDNVLAIRLFADHSAEQGDWWQFGIDSWAPPQDIKIIGFLLRVAFEDNLVLNGNVYVAAQWGTNFETPERSPGIYGSVSSVYYGATKEQTLGDLSVMFPAGSGIMIAAGQPVYLHLSSRGFQTSGRIRFCGLLHLFYILR